MPSRSLGTLTLDIVASVGGFIQGMDKAERQSNKWRKSVKSDLDTISTNIKRFGLASAAGFAAATVHITNNAREIRNLAKVANESTTDFQKITFAASRYGVEQEKVADILKDTGDKVGDFLQTGGGALTDFFENIAPQVGVTADQFRDLSGSDALGLYISSLEKANLSQNEMTFFLEAIASDATLLLPLFRNNAKELNNLGNQAEDFNAIISETDLGRFGQIRDNIDDIKLAFAGLEKEVVLGALPAIEDLTELLSDPETIENAKILANAIVSAFTGAIEAIRETVAVTKFLGEELAAAVAGISAEDISRLERDAKKIRNILSGQNQIERIRFFGPDGIVEFLNDEELRAKLKEIEDAIDSYYQNKNNRPKIPAEIGTQQTDDAGSGAGQSRINFRELAEQNKKAKEDAEKLLKTFNDTKAGLMEQLALEADASEAAQIRYAIENGNLVGINEAQQQELINLANRLDLTNEIIEAAKKEREELDRINQEALNIADSLKTEEEQIRDSYARRRDIILENTEITGLARNELLLKLEEEKNKKLAQLEAARQIAAIQNYETIFGSLADISKAFLGEQSNTYRALFAIEKAAAIARSIVAIQTGLAQASTAPFPANLAAVASVASATAGIISTISGTNLQGQAGDGLDFAPHTGTYLINKGERITTAETSAKLDRTLDRINPNNNRSGIGSGGTVQINNFVDADQFHQIMGQAGGKNQIRNVIREEASLIKQLAAG